MMVFQVINCCGISLSFLDCNIIHTSFLYIRVVNKPDTVVQALYHVIAYLNTQKFKHFACALIAQKHGYSQYQCIECVCTDLGSFCERKLFHKDFTATLWIQTVIFIIVDMEKCLFAVDGGVLECPSIGIMLLVALHAAFRTVACMRS